MLKDWYKHYMIVMLVIRDLGPGGAEKLLSDLLPVLKQSGIEILLVSLCDDMTFAPRIKDAGIEILQLGHEKRVYGPWNLYRSGLKLRALIKQRQPDIIHSHLYLADLLAWIWSPSGCRTVSTLHNVYPWWQWWAARGKRVRYFYMTKVEAILGRLRGCMFVGVSEAVKKCAIRSLGIRADNIKMVYNGIVVDDFEAKNEYRSTESPVIIQVGNYREQKGHGVSLRAFKILRKTYKDARLHLVGDGPLRKQMEKEIEQSGLAGSVILMGRRDDVPELLRESDIFWMPSLFEGLSIACVEAMACGLPVVASNTSGLNEEVSEGLTGYLVGVGNHKQLAEKTMEILRSPDIARGMGVKGRDRVERLFSINSAASSYICIYDEVLGHLKTGNHC